MSAHTPAPWSLRRSDHGNYWEVFVPGVLGDFIIVDQVGGQIRKGPDGKWSDHPEQDANARLIAAAPDMYAANVAMLAALDEAFGIKAIHDDDWIYDVLPSSGIAGAYFMARDAVQKATGDSRNAVPDL